MRSSTTIPVILGQTATGKTSVGIHLATAMNGEIISVDSRKLYKGLTIGTATPEGLWTNNAYVVQGIPHHLIGHLAPDQLYTAGDFARDAERLISEIQNRGKTPLLVGGTGFYFKALEKGLPVLPPRDEKLREGIEQAIKQKGLEKVHAELMAVDPVAAAAISPQDRHKIIRALEIYQLTGQPFSQWKETPRQASRHAFTVVGLEMDKTILDKRIVRRAEEMGRNGMIEETAAVLKDYPKNCPALLSFGYKEAVQVVEGKMSRATFLTHLIRGTKAYAKRQRTWFRTQVHPTWFLCEEKTKSEEISMRIKAFLESPHS